MSRGVEDRPFDGMFLTIAQKCGGIAPLLDEFFSFLHRKTDFYVVDPSKSRPMGFEAGAAETMVIQQFRWHGGVLFVLF
jgi:hypothetical protein